MTTLSAASHQWATRPADQRFTSLTAMLESQQALRHNSRATIVASCRIEVIPSDDHRGITVRGPNGGLATPSHWTFGQLAALAEAPAGYLRTMPAEITADCLNYGLQYKRDVEDVGMLITRDVSSEVITLRAATGPRYGRIWNSEIIEGLIARFGDGTGRDSDWSVPGEFGQAVDITKANTTLFAGDRNMFVFLADEKNRVELPGGGHGRGRELARGFFVWNSEVGSDTFGIATFLFDYACSNRTVWGATEYKQIKMRHTPKAPVRWADEVVPALASYRQSSTANIVNACKAAQAARIDDVGEFLATRFGKRLPADLHDISMEEEGRPIETLWDASLAVTAYAKGIVHQDERVAMERKGGELIDLATR